MLTPLRPQFLDATRKGGIARFVNHSCNPNCYVSKWHVGKYMRMGIFAKRDIDLGEELTFNYNVDRYGNDAQACYCGEPNCVGTIGGKTQTDIGGMDQLFIDALGIADEVDQLEAKGNRRKKSRHLDEDFTPLLRPIEEEEVAKVITAVRQATSNRNILQKLLSRIHMTQDSTVQRCLVRLHGFVLMASVIDEWKDDKEIVLLAMGSLARWPLIARNKVVDSGVDRLVQNMADEDDAEISSLASDLLSAWDTLEMSYRIARKEITARGDTPPPASQGQRKDQDEEESAINGRGMRLEDARAPNSVSKRLDTIAPKLMGQGNNRVPIVPTSHRSWMAPGNHDTPSTPRTPEEQRQPNSVRPPQYAKARTSLGFIAIPPKLKAPVPAALSIEEIIRKANESEALIRKQAEEKAEEEAKQRRAAEEAEVAGSKRKQAESKRPNGDKRARGSEDVSMDVLERRLKKLVGEVVVRYMSVYKDELDREVFKKHARELTRLICGKEMRTSHSWPPKDGLATGLSKEKTKKIKLYVNDYSLKLVARKGKGADASATSPAVAALPHSTVERVGTGGHDEDVSNHNDDDDDDDDDASVRMSGDEGQAEQDHSTTSVSPSASGTNGTFVATKPRSPPPPLFSLANALQQGPTTS